MRLSTLFLVYCAALSAAEGKWTPDQMLKLDRAWLKQQGLQLPPSRLWNPQAGAGLLSAVVSTGGCSGGFISPRGLFLTNHHCLFSIVQEHSTTANDLITNGFLAKSRDEELRSKSARITIPHRFSDVTHEVESAVPAGARDAARFRAIEAKQKALVAECEQNKGHRCRVAAFDGGLQYTLIDAVEIEDVRLVYAPPRSVGEFGGEVDNFGWPRHAGDFAIGRAYVDGQPYRNQFYFPISANGVKPGDFVMVVGYPGITYRSLTAAEMEERRDLFFASRVSLYGEWIGLLEKATENSASGRIAVAANLKSLNNSFKNAQGQLEGFRRGRILEQQRSREREIVTWAAAHPEYSSALDARKELSRLVDEQHRTYNRDFLLNAIPNGPKLLYFATTVVRAAEEREKPDPERDPAYQAREMPRLRERLEREQKNFYLPADQALLLSFAKRALSLEPAERLAMMQVDIGGLYGRTRVTDLAERLKMFDETTAQLRARHDPAIDLGFELEKADPERDPAYQAREMPRLCERLEREQKNFFLPADMALLASFAKRALSLEPAERLAMMQADIDGLYGRTRVTDLAERMKMFDENTAQLRARHDPAIDLAFELEKAREELKQREDTWNGAISRLRPVWRKAVIAQAGRPVAPDANRSLRVSLAHVKGYTPRDAVLYEPRTTLSGMLDKYTGKDPFDAPADVLAAARAGDFGRWADATLKDVPIDFLSDADTTGGNSGSPTVNGRGELVGVNFDRVWENVANDFGYNPAVARNVNADVRYLLWMLDRVKHGDWLLKELGVPSQHAEATK